MSIDEKEFRSLLEERGFELDEGNLIAGPFIPDGRWRVYRTDDHLVIAEGCDLADVMENFNFYGLRLVEGG